MYKIVVYYSNKCHTCNDHIKKMNRLFDLELVDVDEEPNVYETFNLNITPTTILYKNGVETWRKEGMFFESQITELRKNMK